MEDLDIPGIRSLMSAQKQKLLNTRREKAAELLAAMAAEIVMEKIKQDGVNAICVQHSELRQKFQQANGQLSQQQSAQRVNELNQILSYDKDIFERAIMEWLTSVGFSGKVMWNGQQNQTWPAVDNVQNGSQISATCDWKVVASPPN